MVPNSQIRVLVVDDDSTVCATVAMLMSTAGYKVATASDGFQALMQIRLAVPDVIISDLNMPYMSGFEFLSIIRRRFPQVLVVAMSGAYDAGECVPGGVIADAFYAKGGSGPAKMLSVVEALLKAGNEIAIMLDRKSAPVWVPRFGAPANYTVVTCRECLRSFPVSPTIDLGMQEAECLFCSAAVTYIAILSAAAAPFDSLPRVAARAKQANA
jgi:CheY-like chemotaxis protein